MARWATLPDTFVAPVTLVCQSNCSAHTQSVMPRYSFVGCCPIALEELAATSYSPRAAVVAASICEIRTPSATTRRRRRREPQYTPPPTPMLPQPPLLLGQLNVLSRTLSRSICPSVCLSVHLSVCPSDLLPPGCSIVLFLLLSTDLNEPQQRPAPSTRP